MKDAVLITDSRYTDQASDESPLFRVERIEGNFRWFSKLTSELSVNKIGFEDQDITVSDHCAIQKALSDHDKPNQLSLEKTSDTINMMRTVKYQEEMQCLIRAIEITDQAFYEIAPIIKAGMTERWVAWELEKAMRERGSDGLAFDIIVGTGPNSALPHHLADDTVICNHTPIVIDMGAKYKGYCADLTRTIFIGKPDETFQKVYETVRQAQLAAIHGIKSGMTGEEVDAISRDVIDCAGYGNSFGHSLGHGVGLAVHELPRVGPKSKDIIKDGMVFTIEPGIYLSDWGGVRIEDVVLMENGQARVLSKAPKQVYSN